MSRDLTRLSRWQRALLLCCYLLCSCLLASSRAQITLDGSLGPQGPLTGPNFTIPAETGQLRGSNLFHSFDQFNIQTGESATFTGPASVSNIISRVTGGQQSIIDGLLRSEIAEASMYLLNPSGVMFGPGARLDTSGSFHVSTADEMRLADGVRFSASLGDQSTLSIMPPATFGFLSDSPASIAINGSQLQLSEGKTLSIVAGDVQGMGMTLQAARGQLHLVSVASSVEVPVEVAGLQIAAVNQLGSVTLSQGSLLDVSGTSTGTVVIRSGQLRIDGSSLVADTTGSGDDGPGRIDVQTKETVILTNGAQIATDGLGSGGAADITMSTSLLDMSGSATIQAVAQGEGSAGRITINANRIMLTEDSSLSGGTLNNGLGSPMTVIATDSIVISGLGRGGQSSQIVNNALGNAAGGSVTIAAPTLEIAGGTLPAATVGSGAAGSLEVQASRLILRDEGQISTVTTGVGLGGRLTLLVTDTITISGQTPTGRPSRITSDTGGSGSGGQIAIVTSRLEVTGGEILGGSLGEGNAGGIEIQADQVALMAGALISAGTTGAGSGGQITLTASEAVTIEDAQSRIVNNAFADGIGGEVVITAPRFEMRNGLVQAVTVGNGSAGGIEVNADRILLTDGAVISSGTTGSGQAGPVMVRAEEAITISGLDSLSQIFSNTLGQGTGGDVVIDTPRLELIGRAAIRADTSGSGSAGNIRVEADQLTLTGGAQISSVTFGDGQGGQVTVTATDAIVISGVDLNGRPSRIAISAFGDGDGGKLAIMASQLEMDSGVILAFTEGEGRGGDIEIDVDQLTLTEGALIVGSAEGEGRGGDVRIKATDVITIGMEGDESRSQIDVSTSGTGAGGHVSVTASRLDMIGDVIETRADAAGGSGHITLKINQLMMTSGSRINSITTGDGSGGEVSVTATDVVRLDLASNIVTNARGLGEQAGGAGNILVEAQNVWLTGRAQIGSVTSGDGQGGAITVVVANDVRLDGLSILGTDTQGVGERSGSAGDVLVEARNVTFTAGGQISSVSSAAGRGGAVTVKAADTVYPWLGNLAAFSPMRKAVNKLPVMPAL